MATQFRINLLTGATVETLDGNGVWVAAEPGASDFATRDEAQAYIDDWAAAQGDVEQVADVTW